VISKILFVKYLKFKYILRIWNKYGKVGEIHNILYRKILKIYYNQNNLKIHLIDRDKKKKIEIDITIYNKKIWKNCHLNLFNRIKWLDFQINNKSMVVQGYKNLLAFIKKMNLHLEKWIVGVIVNPKDYNNKKNKHLLVDSKWKIIMMININRIKPKIKFRKRQTTHLKIKNNRKSSFNNINNYVKIKKMKSI